MRFGILLLLLFTVFIHQQSFSKAQTYVLTDYFNYDGYETGEWINNNYGTTSTFTINDGYLQYSLDYTYAIIEDIIYYTECQNITWIENVNRGTGSSDGDKVTITDNEGSYSYMQMWELDFDYTVDYGHYINITVTEMSVRPSGYLRIMLPNGTSNNFLTPYIYEAGYYEYELNSSIGLTTGLYWDIRTVQQNDYVIIDDMYYYTNETVIDDLSDVSYRRLFPIDRFEFETEFIIKELNYSNFFFRFSDTSTNSNNVPNSLYIYFYNYSFTSSSADVKVNITNGSGINTINDIGNIRLTTNNSYTLTISIDMSHNLNIDIVNSTNIIYSYNYHDINHYLKYSRWYFVTLYSDTTKHRTTSKDFHINFEYMKTHFYDFGVTDRMISNDINCVPNNFEHMKLNDSTVSSNDEQTHRRYYKRFQNMVFRWRVNWEQTPLYICYLRIKLYWANNTNTDVMTIAHTNFDGSTVEYFTYKMTPPETHLVCYYGTTYDIGVQIYLSDNIRNEFTISFHSSPHGTENYTFVHEIALEFTEKPILYEFEHSLEPYASGNMDNKESYLDDFIEEYGAYDEAEPYDFPYINDKDTTGQPEVIGFFAVFTVIVSFGIGLLQAIISGALAFIVTPIGNIVTGIIGVGSTLINLLDVWGYGVASIITNIVGNMWGGLSTYILDALSFMWNSFSTIITNIGNYFGITGLWNNFISIIAFYIGNITNFIAYGLTWVAVFWDIFITFIGFIVTYLPYVSTGITIIIMLDLISVNMRFLVSHDYNVLLDFAFRYLNLLLTVIDILISIGSAVISLIGHIIPF